MLSMLMEGPRRGWAHQHLRLAATTFTRERNGRERERVTEGCDMGAAKRSAPRRVGFWAIGRGLTATPNSTPRLRHSCASATEKRRTRNSLVFHRLRRPDFEGRLRQNLMLRPFRKRQRPKISEVIGNLRHARPRPIRAKKGLVGDLFQPGKVLQ